MATTLEGEKKALDELIAKKAAAGVASLEDANKTACTYAVSLSEWVSSLSLSDTEYVLTCLNVEQGACVDSGSPVDITFTED